MLDIDTWASEEYGTKIIFFYFVLNFGWVGVRSPKCFSENTHDVYMAYLAQHTYVFMKM